MTREPATILVVDDEPGLREFVGVTLKLAGYRPILASDGAQVAELVIRDQPHLVLMDYSMPSMSGLEALQQLRALGSEVPVIMLTARDEHDDKLAAFNAGADDYLTKPFNARELVARVAAVLRRTRTEGGGADPGQVLAVGELTLVPGNHSVSVGGREVILTRTEYALLLTLARAVGRVFTPAELLSRVWGPEYRDQAEILRTNMYRLRRKVEADPSAPRHIRTRPGVGYYLAA
ncbi:MAG TPA: response regulator transcription factor [Chloroflexota bacterium]